MGTETAPEAALDPGTSSRLHLESRMTVQHASALLENLQALEGQDVDLDASSIVSVSTPCLQILLAASEAWHSAGRRLRVTDPSTDFLMALDHLGISLDALQSQESPTCP